MMFTQTEAEQYQKTYSADKIIDTKKPTVRGIIKLNGKLYVSTGACFSHELGLEWIDLTELSTERFPEKEGYYYNREIEYKKVKYYLGDSEQCPVYHEIIEIPVMLCLLRNLSSLGNI